MPIINGGTCKPEQVHGNRKRDGPVYIRTPGTTMEAITDQVRATSVDIDDATCDERVVRTTNNGKKDERRTGGRFALTSTS